MVLARSAFSFSLRSSTSLLSSFSSIFLYPLLEARGDEIVEIAVEHALRVALLDAGAQILDARLVEDVGADLVAPADVGLGVLHLLLLLVLLAQLQLVELALEHR